MSTAPNRPFAPEPTPLLEEQAPAAVQPLNTETGAQVQTGDGEWVGEKTILIAEEQNPQAWLQIVATGEWLCLNTLPAILGRHERADLRLDDPSVSRRHARLSQEGEHGFVIEDLGSSNGIRVEGNLVERLMILDGDAFDLGHVALRFSTQPPAAMSDALQAHSGSTVPAAASGMRGFGEDVYTPNLKRLAPVAIAAVTMIIAVAMYVNRTPRTVVVPEPTATVTAPPQTQQPVTTTNDQPAVAPAAVPATRPLAGSRAAQTSTETSTDVATQQPAGAEPAADTSAQAPAGESATASTADAGASDQVAGMPLKRSTKMASSGSSTAASPPPANVDTTPKSKTTQDSAELARKLASATTRPAARPRPKAKSAPIRRSPEFSRAYIDTALQMYLDGDSANAVRRLGIMSRSRRNQKQFRDEAAGLQQQVQALVENYELGQSALDRGDRGEAAVAWARFLRDESELFGGSSSVYARRISRVVAEQYIRDGDKANAEGRFHDAYRSWTKALQYEPEGVARDSILRLEQEGQELYREGYRLESVNIERAKKYWTEVTIKLPPETEYHIKARAKLRWHEQGGR